MKNMLHSISLILGLVFSTTLIAKEIAPPNILFIIFDDLNDAVGAYGGHPQAQTPSLDRLAKDGVVFTNAQANVPVCGPSRISLLTGILPRTSGYFGYNFIEDHWCNNPVLKDSVTFIEHFRRNGYKTLGTGKIFHNHQDKPSVWDDFGHLASWGPWPYDGTSDQEYEHSELSPWRNAVPHPQRPELGIDGMFSRLSDIPSVMPDPAIGVPGHRGWRLYFKGFRYEDEENRDPMPDELNARWASERLAEDHGKPFLMCVGINRPHSPMVAPDTFYDQFPLESIKLAVNKLDDLEDCLEAFVPPGALISENGWAKHAILEELGLLKEWTQAYLANVAFADAQVGKILDALEKSAYADNTLVIVTSDNGYHIGEKSYMHKDTPWEESCRVPFIVRGPGVEQGSSCSKPIALIDIYPTLTDFAGISSTPNKGLNERPLDGHSLVPLLRYPVAGEWGGEDFAVSAVRGTDPLEIGKPGNPHRQHYSLRSEKYRYIRASTGEEELYDHEKDPFEWNNLAGVDGYRVVLDEFRARLNNHLLRD